MLRNLTLFLTFLTVLMLSGQHVSAEEKICKKLFTNVAIDGYDPVAYFAQGRPVKGDEKLSYKWKDAQWQFASFDNLQKFKSDPERYAPQYGGFCAYAMIAGKIEKSDAQYWQIFNNKLYLTSAFYHTEWQKDIPDNIRKADQQWEIIKNQSHKICFHHHCVSAD